MAVAVQTLIGNALTELNVLQNGATAPAALGTFALSKLNQILDNWNAEREAVWCEVFTEFTLTANLTPHTVGPTGTFVMARPVSLDGCALNINTSTPNVYVPMAIITRWDYEALAVPGAASGIPVAVYYEPDMPNGKLFFYLVPNVAYKVRLTTAVVLTSVALTDTITFPPGYENALMLTLAEDLAAPLGRDAPASVSVKAREARARIQANNVSVPTLNLHDGQGPSSPSLGTAFSWKDRSFR